MIPTPSARPRLSVIPPLDDFSCQASTPPTTVSHKIHSLESRFTRLEFRDLTGLSCFAMDKFQELGFIKPFGVWENGSKVIYYSLEDLNKVRVMMVLLDGTLDLKQAHKKAEDMIAGKTPVPQNVIEALKLMSPERRIDRPYEGPTDPKKREIEDPDTEQDIDGPQKPHRVNLCVAFADGTHQSKELAGRDVPRRIDWEDRADRLWLESDWSKHGPVVKVWMEDESGEKYLQGTGLSITKNR